MPTFSCKKCGRCCFFDETNPLRSKPFSIWGWEKDYLEKVANLNDISLSIFPTWGFFKENKMLVSWYIIKFNGKCPFLVLDKGCLIHGRKPLICAQYPYPDNYLTPNKPWNCLAETIQGQKVDQFKGERKSWYLNPQHHTDLLMAYSTQIIRLFNQYKKFKKIIDLKTPKEIYRNKIGTIQIKDLYEELTKKAFLPPEFLNFMNRYTFTDLAAIKKGIKQVRKKMKKISLNQTLLDGIFNDWGSSEFKLYDYTPENDILPDSHAIDLRKKKKKSFRAWMNFAQLFKYYKSPQYI